MSVCWRIYFRAKQKQADQNIPQLVEIYFRKYPMGFGGKSRGTACQASPGACPEVGRSRCSERDTSKGQTPREPFCSLSDQRTEASREKESLVNLYANVIHSYWFYRKGWFVWVFFCPHLIWCNDCSHSGTGHLLVPAHGIAQLLGALSQQQA